MLIEALLDPIIHRALEEDLSGGDLSAECCIPEETKARAVAVAKAPLVVCGGQLFRRVFEILAGSTGSTGSTGLKVELRFETVREDGARCHGEREPIWKVEGPARLLLAAERTALNFVQRMSGTATLARKLVDALPAGSTTKIIDTRKTTPGLRYLDRYAVRTGGAYNHRDNLGSAVLIKDNHIVAAGGITLAIERARKQAPHTSKVEVEVQSLKELDEALAARADIILLDHFNAELTRAAILKVQSQPIRPLIESSGNITEARIRELAELGVDLISFGALTHSAPAADISLGFTLG